MNQFKILIFLAHFGLVCSVSAQGTQLNACSRNITTEVISACAVPPCWYRAQEIGTAVVHVNTLPAYLPIPADACVDTQDAKIAPSRLPINNNTRFLQNSRNNLSPESISAEIQQAVRLPGDVVYNYKKWVLIPAPHCFNPFNSSIVLVGNPLVSYTANRATAPTTCNDYRVNSVCMYNAGFSPVLGNYPSCEDNTNGSCGSANNASLAVAPSGGALCNSGTASSVSGSGPWSWTCTGSGFSATSTSCQADRTTNGVCGSSSGATLTSAPTSNLCNSGVASSVSGSGPWNWTCAGSGSNATSANCSASNDRDCSIRWYVGSLGPMNDTTIPLGAIQTFPTNAVFTHIGAGLSRTGSRFSCPAPSNGCPTIGNYTWNSSRGCWRFSQSAHGQYCAGEKTPEC